MTIHSQYKKTYTITIIGRSGSVHYNIAEWSIHSDTDRLEFVEGDKIVITTGRYTIAEE